MGKNLKKKMSKMKKMAKNGKKCWNFKNVCFIGVFHAKRTPGKWYWSFSYDFGFKGYSKVNFLGQKQAIKGGKRPKQAKITNNLEKMNNMNKIKN